MSLNTILATTPLTSTNYVLKATGTTIGNSLIFDNGTSVGIGTNIPDAGAPFTIDKTGAGLQTLAYFQNQQAAAADTGTSLYFLGTTGLNSLGRLVNAWEGASISSSYMAFWTRGGGTTSERLRITSAGNVGIGTSSPSTKLGISGTAGNIVSDMGNGDLIDLFGGTISSANEGIGIGFTRAGSQMAYIKAGRESTGTNEAAFLAFATQTSGGTHPERMRITSGGNVGIGANGTNGKLDISMSTTANPLIYAYHTAASPYGMRINYSTTPNNTDNWFIYADDSTALRFSVRSNGGIANYSGNNVNLASDRRLKKDIVPLSNEWEKLKQIEVVNFKYNDSTDETALYGAIAQQVQEVYPNLVVVTREATETEPEYYGLREQPFQWLTTKVLQEAMTKIEELSKQNEELSNRLIKLESK
jgi:hypothetical protein